MSGQDGLNGIHGREVGAEERLTSACRRRMSSTSARNPGAPSRTASSSSKAPLFEDAGRKSPTGYIISQYVMLKR